MDEVIYNSIVIFSNRLDMISKRLNRKSKIMKNLASAIRHKLSQKL